MHVRAELAALDYDDAPQLRAQERTHDVFAAWRSHRDTEAWGAALERFGAGASLEDCPALAALFGDDAAPAEALVERLVATGIAALGAEPLSHVPLRHGGDEARATLQIAQSGAASLSLVMRSGAALAVAPAPQTASFTPARHWSRVMAVNAVAAQFMKHAGRAPSVREIALSPGGVLQRDLLSEALHFRSIAGTLVTLELSLRDDRADAACEVALADGAFLRQSARDPRDSRHTLMAALLCRMGRRDAAPALAALAQGASPAALRWEALREALALDTRTGFDVLATVAQRVSDPLAGPARSLRAQLIAAHPQLAEIPRCRA